MKIFLRNLVTSLLRALPPSLNASILRSFELDPDLALKAGYRVMPQRFDSPIVNRDEVDRVALKANRNLPGLHFDWPFIETLVCQLVPYKNELGWLPPSEGKGNFGWGETYTTIDTYFLYTVLRALKPKRYIEIGCGHTSRISAAALKQNKQESYQCKASYIEPFPGERLEGVELPGELIVKKVQEIPLSFFQELEEGDVLFIDTSHVIKAQSDVEYELLHIIPSLKKGVHIHIHDIFTPYDYPEEWLIGPRENWGTINEQYPMEALLSSSNSFKITLPLYLMLRERRDLVDQVVCGSTDGTKAFWFVTQ